MDTQWTGLAASRGPETRKPMTEDQAWQSLKADMDAMRARGEAKTRARDLARGIEIGEGRERSKHLGSLDAAYRAGELAGCVKAGLVVGALVLWAGWLSGRGR